MPKRAEKYARAFPQRLRELRKKRGVPQVTLSGLCGLNPGAIGRYELGRGLPGLPALYAICEELDCSADYLLGRSDQVKP